MRTVDDIKKELKVVSSLITIELDKGTSIAYLCGYADALRFVKTVEEARRKLTVFKELMAILIEKGISIAYPSGYADGLRYMIDHVDGYSDIIGG